MKLRPTWRKGRNSESNLQLELYTFREEAPNN